MTSRNDRHLEELPHSLLTEISSYLCGRGGKVHHTGSDILLAVALSASQSSWEKCQSTNTQQLLSPASKAVLSMHVDDWRERWKIFDFGHAQMNAGSSAAPHDKLNDVDLKAILIIIDAPNNLKSLKLTGCVNISGHGLEPLVTSNVLERIDLSLVTGDYNDKANKYINERIALSEDIVLPILRGIVQGESMSLRYVEFPLHWRNKRSPELSQLMEEYNDTLENASLTCQYESEEDGSTQRCEEESGIGLHLEGERYGVQTGSCNECLKHFCAGGSHRSCFDYCDNCQKYNCISCNFVCNCNECEKSSCLACAEVKLCAECHTPYCNDCKTFFYCLECYKSVCSMECGPIVFCTKCFDSFCMDCMPGKISFCNKCFESSCFDCMQMMFCMKCYSSYCMKCGMISFCEGCNEMMCHDCAKMSFNDDDQFLCSDCNDN